MTITRIPRLRSCGIFRDFAWSTDLEEFSRYNLIYGWNGTGKSTLGRILRCLQQRTPPTAGEVTVRLGDADFRGDQFPTATVPIRVFNREFVAESVFPVGGPTRPIFVLGRENVEAQRRIEGLRTERITAQGTLDAANTSKRTAESNLDQFCIAQARTIKDLLRSAGQNPYNTFDKAAFRRRADELIAAGNAAALRLSDADRDAAEIQMRGTAKPVLTEVAQSLPHLADLHSTVASLLGQTVVSQAIAALTSDAALESWTRQGLTLHQQKGRAECLFCLQQMPQGRLEALEGHFNTAYQRFMEQLTACAASLQAAEQAMSAIRPPDAAALYEDLAGRYRAASELFEADRTSIRQFVEGLRAAIQDKQSKAFVQVNVTLAIPTLNQTSIEGINAILHEHNQTSAGFQSRIEAARERLAKHMIAGGVEDLGRLKDAVTAADQGVTSATTEVGRLSAEIRRLEAELVLHRRPADELNGDLKRYLGHSELQLSVEETGYAITRAGVQAEGLSEGERTAIALLYFLKSLEDRDFDLANGVVVLDDPVSSLDQNALFAAFGFLRVRTQPAGQLFILTHNFMLFRLTREWLGNLRGQDKEERIYMLRCDAATGQRASVLAPIDRLLTEFESEYQYLFSRMYRMATDAPATSLEAYYMAPSIARRVIETFLAFKIPDLGGENRLWSRMQQVAFDQERASRIYRFLQTHSHRDAAGEADEDLTILAESRSVLNDVVAFMQHADGAHVSRMISLLAAATPEAEATT